MRRVGPLLVVLLAAAAAVVVLTRGGAPSGPAVVAPGDDGSREAGTPPPLVSSSDLPRAPTSAGGRAPEGAPAAAERPAPDKGPHLRGIVLDASTGKAVAHARVGAEIASATCPRLPNALLQGDLLLGARAATFDPADTVLTDPDGTFALAWSRDVGDVFVSAAGYVLACECGARVDAPVTIRLVPGLSISGLVTRTGGAPVAAASVTAAPAPGVPMLPGHVAMTTTDAEGKFELTGLVPGPVVVTVDHRKHMPVSLPPMEPGATDVRVVLVPALVATLHLHTDDGKEPDAPSLAWKTSGNPPKEGLQLLTLDRDPATPADQPVPPPGTYVYEPVRLPCDRPDVTLTVKSVGYSPWAFGPDPLPVDGGEKTYEVNLGRDPSLGGIKLTLEDKQGNPLSYVAERAMAVPGRRDRQPIPAGVILKPGDALEMPALPAGPYVLLVLSPLHAPAVVPADVAPGQTTEVKAVMGPPAKVRVKFTAPERLIVQFRLRLGKDDAYPFPETAPGEVATAEDKNRDVLEGVLHAGEGGLLLTGLATGRYTVEVTSPELVATPTPVDLAEGETTEIEIPVQKR